MAEKERVIGNAAIAAATEFMEVKVKVEDDTIDPGARTTLSVSLRSLWPAAIAAITIEPIANPMAMAAAPTIAPVNAGPFMLEAGETETYDFILTNNDAADLAGSIDVLVWAAVMLPHATRAGAWRAGLPDPGSAAPIVPGPAPFGAIGVMPVP